MSTPDSGDETLGEKMNRQLYLDPGFTLDRPRLIDALEDEIDETVERAQAALDQRRADETAPIAGVPDSADEPQGGE
jgi:hypothetical protein